MGGQSGGTGLAPESRAFTHKVLAGGVLGFGLFLPPVCVGARAESHGASQGARPGLPLSLSSRGDCLGKGNQEGEGLDGHMGAPHPGPWPFSLSWASSWWERTSSVLPPHPGDNVGEQEAWGGWGGGALSAQSPRLSVGDLEIGGWVKGSPSGSGEGGLIDPLT